MSTAHQYIDYIIRSTVHLIAYNQRREPISCGSGVLISYKERVFIISCEHVIPHDSYGVMIEDNKTNWETLSSINFSCPPFIFYDIAKIVDRSSDNLEQAAPKKDTLDFAFTELTGFQGILQQSHKIPLSGEGDSLTYLDIEGGYKNILDISPTYTPSYDSKFALSGRINQSFNGARLRSEIKIEGNMKFISSGRFYETYSVDKIIKKKKEYAGCSGGPIIDDEGNLAGIFTNAMIGEKRLYVFPVRHIAFGLDLYINNGFPSL